MLRKIPASRSWLNHYLLGSRPTKNKTASVEITKTNWSIPEMTFCPECCVCSRWHHLPQVLSCLLDTEGGSWCRVFIPLRIWHKRLLLRCYNCSEFRTPSVCVWARFISQLLKTAQRINSVGKFISHLFLIYDTVDLSVVRAVQRTCYFVLGPNGFVSVCWWLFPF